MPAQRSWKIKLGLSSMIGFQSFIAVRIHSSYDNFSNNFSQTVGFNRLFNKAEGETAEPFCSV